MDRKNPTTGVVRLISAGLCCLVTSGCSSPDAEPAGQLDHRNQQQAPQFDEAPPPPTECPSSAEITEGTPWSEELTLAKTGGCVLAGAGNDIVYVQPGQDRTTVFAGAGDDTTKIDSDAHLTQVALGDGNDHLDAHGGAVAAWGDAGEDLLEGSPAADYLFGGLGKDSLLGAEGDDRLWGDWGDDTVEGGSGSDRLFGGPGNDRLAGGSNDDVLHGGKGADKLDGGSGSDLMEGGPGTDVLRGGEGDDRLLGQAGDDTLQSGLGDDLLIPGAGLDHVQASKGDDLIVILDACQIERGETIDGGDGTDTLLSPLPLSQLLDLGVEVSSIETVSVFPEGGFECDRDACDCGVYETAPILDNELCDYSSPAYEMTPQQREEAQKACQDFLAEIGERVETLPEQPTTQDAEDLLEKHWHDALAPTRIANISTTTPHRPEFPPSEPIPGVSTSTEPCDMPDRDIHIGVARGGLNNCYGSEKSEVRDALDASAFMIFRMRQQIDAVVDAAENPEEATSLWNQGSEDDWGRFALSWWFGEYDADRVKVIQSTVGELEEIFFADDDKLTGPKHNVQCYHRLKWWQYILFGKLNPATILFKTVANSCFYKDQAAAHAIFAETFGGWAAAASVYYPFESIELCESAFDWETFDPPERLGGIIMHELLHFHDNSQGRLKDNHGDTADEVCGGKCYEEEDARALAVAAPDYAVVNIDNYRTWANTAFTLYAGGYCDDTSPGLCFPSDCCGDGVLQPNYFEHCDGADFGDRTCLSEAGLTEGALSCSNDCQVIGTDACHGSCGNGAIDPALDEACDTLDFGTQSCAALFGSEMGSLTCSGQCTVETAGCEGAFPATYLACGVEPGSACLGSPEACHETAGSGTCTGGPCSRADPGNRVEGQSNPNAPFHPKGNFRDEEGNLYRCDDGPDGPRTCVDEEGWGVCKECGLGEGQTTLGCPCQTSSDCALDQTCFGGQFPHGGYCWAADDGPPDFQCEQGGCGQSYYDNDGGSYCEHYALSGTARCMPEICDNIAAQACSEQGLICDATGSGCMNECGWEDDCTSGWPGQSACGPSLTCEFQP